MEILEGYVSPCVNSTTVYWFVVLILSSSNTALDWKKKKNPIHIRKSVGPTVFYMFRPYQEYYV